MTERDDERDGGPSPPESSDPLRDEPEPEWAAEIRRLRRARGDRLRRVFSSFDDEQEER